MSWLYSRRMTHEYMSSMQSRVQAKEERAEALLGCLSAVEQCARSARPEDRASVEAIHDPIRQGRVLEDVCREAPLCEWPQGNSGACDANGSTHRASDYRPGMCTSHQRDQDGQPAGELGADEPCRAFKDACAGIAGLSDEEFKGSICVSLHCLRAPVAGYLQATCSDGEQSVQSNTTKTHDAYSAQDKMTQAFRHSLSGMTCGLLTEENGRELLILYLEGFHAKPSARLLLDATMLTIFGRRCEESFQMQLPGLSMPRTYRQKQSTLLLTTSNRWATKQKHYLSVRKTWVLTTFGKDIGFLHTPTTQGNYCADSMQKWPSCREYRAVFGRVTPENQEWLMGWPQGWTELKPLETGRFQSWQCLH